MKNSYNIAIATFFAMHLIGCGRGPNADKSLGIIPILIFVGFLFGGLWFIGNLIDGKSNFVDSVMSGLVVLMLISVVLFVLNLLIKIF